MKTNSLKENLVYHRKLNGYTQEELSDKSSVTVRTIQRIEKGDVNPHLQTVKLLAVGLGIEVEDLIVLDDPKQDQVKRKWMLFLHGSAFFGLIIPLANIFFPLVLWIHKADDNKVYDDHGRAIVNFHTTMNLMILLSLMLFFVIPGYNYFITGFVLLFGIIVSILNLSSALNKQTCNYPFSIPFLKSKRQ